MERSISPDSILMIKAAQSAGVTLAWDRYEAQLPQCGFGETGLCCRHCLQGPCRIDLERERAKESAEPRQTSS